MLCGRSYLSALTSGCAASYCMHLISQKLLRVIIEGGLGGLVACEFMCTSFSGNTTERKRDVELMVCFETSFEGAAQRKKSKYFKLREAHAEDVYTEQRL